MPLGLFCLLVQVWAAPQAVPSDLDTALGLATSGRYAEAEQILARLERAEPQNAEVKYRLGLVLLRQGKLPQARARLETAVKLSPQSPLVWLALAQVKLRLGDAAGAGRAAEQARSLGGREHAVSKALFLYDVEAIRSQLRSGQAKRAVELARQAIAREDAAVFRHLLGQAYALRRDPAAAVAELQEAIRLDPDRPEYYGDLAALFLDHRTPEPAEMVLGAAARRFPKSADVARMLGVAYLGQGRTAEAIDAFLRAIDLDPDAENGYASLQTLLPSAADRLPEITRRLAAFAEKHPTSPVGHYLLALASPDGAEQRLRRAIAAAPDFWPAQFELHKLLKEQGKWPEAAAALEKVIALNPEHAPAHFSLAQVYAQLGDRERARREREIHHKLAVAQRAEEQKQREQAPRLSFQLSDR